MGRSTGAWRSLCTATIALTGLFPALPVLAQAPDAYPSRLLKMVVPFPAGQGADTAARVLGKELEAVSGQTVIIDNRPGGNNVIGARAVTTAAPDGHTLFYGSNSPMAANGVFYKELGYDPVKDFTPVALLGKNYWVLVISPEAPHKTFAELVEFSKKNPKAVSVGAGATGYQLAAILMTNAAGMKANIVPYKGSPQAITDVLGQHVTVTMADFGTLRPLIASGRLRALLVLNDQRIAGIPDIPSLKDLKLDMPILFSWTAVFTPANTPKLVRDRLAGFILEAVKRDAYVEYSVKSGLEQSYAGPDALGEFQKQQIEAYRQAMRVGNVEPQ